MVLVIRFPQAMGLLLVLGSVLGAPARAQTGEPILRIETGTHTARMSAAGADAAGQVLVTAAATEIPSTQPTATPILRLETGMHTADILARSVDAAGRLLLTASIDKTARLWSLPDGHLLTVLRPPQEFGQEGQLFGAALSPDGATAAVSGWTGASWDGRFFIYLFDTRTGRMISRLSTEKNILQNLAFSPDGRFLVGGRADCCGIRAWRTNGWTVVEHDAEADGHVSQLSFDRSGWLVTVSDDDFIRLYDPSFHLIEKVQTPGGDRPFGVSFSPDGSQVAVTYPYVKPSRVDVLSGRDLRQLFAPDVSGILARKIKLKGDLDGLLVSNSIVSVTWSADGRTLYAGGFIQGPGPDLYDEAEQNLTAEQRLWNPIPPDNRSFISSWSDGGRGARQDQWAPGMLISTLVSLPGGGLVFTGMPPLWGTIGTVSDVLQQGVTAYFASPNVETFQLSADGNSIAFGLGFNNKHAVVMSLADRSLRSISELPSGLDAPMLSAPGMSVTVTMWEQPRLNGQILDLQPGDYSNAVSVRNNTVLVGSLWGLRLFDRNGRLLWKQSISAPAAAVNLSSDGRFAVAGYSDGTIRWYRASDGQELLAFFPHNDGKRWVLWTPSGYYDASPGGEDLIGWHINRSKDQAADFFPASRFADTMHRPDVINQVLATLDEGKAVKLANAAADRNDARITPDLIVTLVPPVLELVDAPTRFATDHVTVKYRVRNPADAGTIDSPRIMVNGEWQPTSRAVYQRAADGTRDVVIGPLPPHDSTVRIYADNGNARSEPLTIELQWDARAALAPGQQGRAAQHKPRLFVLAVGISQYQRPDLRLNFAARDAEQFVAAMQAQRGKLYAEVTTKLLRDDEATLAGVEAGLAWFAGQAAADDVGVLFLAGHGVQTPDQDYFYAPSDFDPARQRATGVNYRAIRSALDKFSTSGNKVLFFVDTCYPGGALGPNLAASNGTAFAAVLSRSDSGIVVLSATKGDQLSYEGPQWQDGAFTKALLEGIVDAKADPWQSGEITILDLGSYIHKRVLVLTGQRQEPILSMPEGGVADFTVAAH
jgi:WD40 repeat protein